MAEEKLGVDGGGSFSLVHESHYLPDSGRLDKPMHIFEIRVRGRAGGKRWPIRAEVERKDRLQVDMKDFGGKTKTITLYGRCLTEDDIRQEIEKEEWDWAYEPHIHFKEGQKEYRLGR
jgi:hypothetical protein